MSAPARRVKQEEACRATGVIGGPRGWASRIYCLRRCVPFRNSIFGWERRSFSLRVRRPSPKSLTEVPLRVYGDASRKVQAMCVLLHVGIHPFPVFGNWVFVTNFLGFGWFH